MGEFRKLVYGKTTLKMYILQSFLLQRILGHVSLSMWQSLISVSLIKVSLKLDEIKL